MSEDSRQLPRLSSAPLPKPPKRVLTRHRFRWTARRARRQWMSSVRGRDAYVYRRGFMRYDVSYIDYKPRRAA